MTSVPEIALRNAAAAFSRWEVDTDVAWAWSSINLSQRGLAHSAFNDAWDSYVDDGKPQQ